MGNTVGSRETKFWQKKWVPIKASLAITPRQRDIIIGSLLGDGTMRVGSNARNANFKVEHGLEQKALVSWKYRGLRSLVFTGPRLSYRYRESGEKYAKSWWFRTIRHPQLTEIYRKFYTGEQYRTGRKIVPSSIAKDLSPRALAAWIMDDGNFSQNAINISTYSFSLAEIRLLKAVLTRKFGVAAKFHCDRDKGYRMAFGRAASVVLIRIVRPHIIPSMRYKIGLATP